MMDPCSMIRPGTADDPTPRLLPPRSYLICYNNFCALGWGVVLWRLIATLCFDGPAAVYPAVHDVLRFTQSWAFLEIAHSFLGVVRSSLLTTLLQVSSRLFLIWGVLFPFPELAQSVAYSSLVFAWSITEVIRYTYFFLEQLDMFTPPFPLTWLRYNTFFVLYPVGITSECVLMFMAAVGPAWAVGWWASLPYLLVLLIYVPGSYILYTHMMGQRKKAVSKRETGRPKRESDLVE